MSTTDTITYKSSLTSNVHKVYLGKKHVGNIMATIDGKYQYWPHGAKDGGEKFATLRDCKRSLESL